MCAHWWPAQHPQRRYVVWGAAGVGPRTDPVSHVHSRLAAADKSSPTTSARIYWRYSEIYEFCKLSSTDILCQSLSACVNDASRWLKSNRLLLNPVKMEILWCSSPPHRNLIPTQPISIVNASVVPVSAVRNLGIYVDADVIMNNHVTVTILSCFGALWLIHSVLRSLLTRLADPDMCSCGQQGRLLHFCTCWHHWSLNVLVTFCPECRSRLVFSARKSEHIIPLVHEPHWLRVPECIQFHGTAPVYLAESLHRKRVFPRVRRQKICIRIWNDSVTFEDNRSPNN